MKRLILIIIYVIVFCSGCWNYKELNDLGVVSAIGISKDNEEYVLDIELLNITSEDSNLIEAPSSILTGRGKSIFEAARSINKKTSKILFLANIDYVFIDKDVLSGDIKDILDFLIRDTRLSLNFLIVTSTTNNSKEILSSISQFDSNSAKNIYEIINNSESRYGGISSIHIRDLVNSKLSYGKGIIYPNVSLVNNIDNSSNSDILKDSNSLSYVEVNDMVFFKDNNIVSLDSDVIKGYNFVNNNIKNATITCKCDGGYFTVETLESDFKLVDELEYDSIRVKGDVGAEIVYYNCDGNLDDTKVLSNISNIVSKEIGSYISKGLDIAKEYRYDFLGIGSFIYKNNYSYFDFKNRDWNRDGLSNISFIYDINISLYKQGNLRGDL